MVFTLGSLIVNSPGSFYRESAEAARILGKRAVLLVGEGASDYADLISADVHVGAYAPHSLLFPRAAAIVHQAGIGTLHRRYTPGGRTWRCRFTLTNWTTRRAPFGWASHGPFHRAGTVPQLYHENYPG